MSEYARHIWLFARLTLREAWRRRLLWIAVGLSLAFLALYAVGFWAAHRDAMREFGDPGNLFAQTFVSTFTMIGLYAVNFLIVMTTVLTAVGSLSQEISSNTIHTLAAKPVRRWEIFVGKWLGHALMLAGYTGVLFGGVLLSVFAVTGYYLPPSPWQGLALMLLEGLVILSVTLFGSSRLSTLANGVVVFMLYGLSFVGAWTEQLGALFDSPTAVDLGILSSLILPGEALWRRAAYLMQTSLARNFGGSPFGAVSVPSGWFVLYAGLYVAVMVALGIRAFARRDL